jgi:hypothetical protein
VVGLIVVAAAVVLGAGATSAQTAIGSKQHFLGAVNGQTGHATVTTVCPGPERPSELGPLAGGQQFLVVETPTTGGYTGLFKTIYAWFVPLSGGAAPVQVKIAAYGVPVKIPTTVRVPCSGTGKVEFSSCPYLAPCAAGWTPNVVRVTYEDIAV